MNVNRESQPATLARDVEEKEILERFVIAGGGLAAAHVTRVSESRFRRIRIIEIEFAEICGFVLDRHRTVSFLSLERRGDDLFDVNIQRGGQSAQFQVPQISPQKFL